MTTTMRTIAAYTPEDLAGEPDRPCDWCVTYDWRVLWHVDAHDWACTACVIATLEDDERDEGWMSRG